MELTNHSGISLSLGVWLSHDDYDYDDRSNHISATSLLKPLKQFIMTNRVDQEILKEDISRRIPSSMGSAIHNGIEDAWVNHYRTNLKKLGYPDRVIDRIRINPTDEELKADEDIIPVYLEQRAEREIDGFIISGKFDFIGEGRVEDFKSTSVYSYMHNTKDDDYAMQGSIYRWLNPEKITRDDMAIQFIFTDWSGARTREPNYPNQRVQEHRLTLHSIQETESYIKRRLASVKDLLDAPEEDIPPCTDSDLWRKETVYKYYKNPEKRSRSTKNYANKTEADIRAQREGGIVVTVPGEVVACRFCKAFDICKQGQAYLASGELNLRG